MDKKGEKNHHDFIMKIRYGKILFIEREKKSEETRKTTVNDDKNDFKFDYYVLQ